MGRGGWISVGAAVAILAAATILWASFEGPLRDPEAAFEDFTSASFRAEIQLTDPLILAGPRVRPRVHEAIKDRNFRLRRYAIAYLGCAGYAAALPTFEQILADPSERDYFRADSLEAIWLIAPGRGRVLAQSHANSPDFLGRAASALIYGDRVSECRTWFEAFTGFKD
jgi:hypothetical protein